MTDNRTNILRVALKLYAAYGYDAVGVQQIAVEAEVTKPTLYHYFQSKRGLFEALLDEHSLPLLTELKVASRYNHDITQSITQVVRVYFVFFKHNPAFYRLMLATSFVPPSSEIFACVSELQARQYMPLEQMFLDAAPDHGNMRGRHKQYAVSLRGMIDTYVALALHGHVQLDRDEMVYGIVHQFMHGIFS